LSKRKSQTDLAQRVFEKLIGQFGSNRWLLPQTHKPGPAYRLVCPQAAGSLSINGRATRDPSRPVNERTMAESLVVAFRVNDLLIAPEGNATHQKKNIQ
jgi:hypothetical protein